MAPGQSLRVAERESGVVTRCNSRRVRNVLGIPFNAMTMSEALDTIDEAIAHRKRIQVGVVNAAKFVNMKRDDALWHDVLSSDLIFADGMSVVWASRILGCPLPERVTGIDLMMGMLARGHKKRYRIFFLGARDDVLEAVVERVGREYPGVQVAGKRNGYYEEGDEAAIALEIRRSAADVLLVAMTSPKKEKFLARWSDTLNVAVCHGVGGSFDVYAGKVERAPQRWQELGLEWLFRLKQEPGRLWKRYLVTNALFAGMVMSGYVRRRLASAGTAGKSGQ